MALPGIGNVSYNGLAFNGPMVSSSVKIEPVRGDDDRAISYYNVEIEMKATIEVATCGILPSAATAGHLNITEQIRAMLSQDGRPLIFHDRVFENFRVNTGDSGDLIDVNHGPRVRVSSIVPIVSNKAYEVVWSVVAAVGECPVTSGGEPTGGFSRSWQEGDIRQFIYTVEWQSDHRGYSTRTVSGYMDIVLAPAMHDNVLTITADDYRESLTVHCPEGFRRTKNLWSLNEKRDRVQFSIVDEEIDSPNAYPRGVVSIEVKHEIAIGAPAFTQASSTLSGHCEVANGLPTSVAWERIYPILNERIEAARNGFGGIFLTGVRVTEYLFARRIEFSLSYYKLKSSPLGFLRSSGMFKPANPDNNWDDWRKTMYGPDEETNDPNYVEPGVGTVPLPWARRSAANLSFEPSDDKIVTPCTEQPFDVSVHNYRFEPFSRDLVSALSNVCPPRDKSYVVYRSKLTAAKEGGATSYVVMPPAAYVEDVTPVETEDGVGLLTGANPDEQTAKISDATATSPMIEFILSGQAMRLGYPVERPKLATEDTTLVVAVPDGDITQETDVKYLGCRLFIQSWHTRYKIKKSITDAVADLGELFRTLFTTTDYPIGDLGEIE